MATGITREYSFIFVEEFLLAPLIVWPDAVRGLSSWLSDSVEKVYSASNQFKRNWFKTKLIQNKIDSKQNAKQIVMYGVLGVEKL